MDEKTIHDLAIAYAQVKLLRIQREYPDRDGSNSELRSFVKAYCYARYQIPLEYEDLDEIF